MHVVCAWLGNSQPVAAKHYLQVTKAHFEQATQKATQQAAAPPVQVSQVGVSINAKSPALPGLATSCDMTHGYSMGGTGLEPVTSTV